jgi:hypothetical protein
MAHAQQVTIVARLNTYGDVSRFRPLDGPWIDGISGQGSFRYQAPSNTLDWPLLVCVRYA